MNVDPINRTGPRAVRVHSERAGCGALLFIRLVNSGMPDRVAQRFRLPKSLSSPLVFQFVTKRLNHFVLFLAG